MKIAIVHDYIKEYGGAERVLEVLHEMYPDAPVFTLIYAPQFLGPHKERFKNWDIRPSFLQYIPWSYKFISIYRLLAPFVFPLFNFSHYDVVLVSATGAYSPNTIRVKRKALRVKGKEQESFTLHPSRFPLQVCYYHTPPRYLYGFATARKQSNNMFFRMFTSLMILFLRKIDISSSKNVDIAITNSENVRERIKKFYKKEAIVVYPPVDVSMSSRTKLNLVRDPYGISPASNAVRNDKEKFFLAGGRLARPKHIDLIINACVALGVPLKIFGRGFAGYEKELKEISNVKYPMSNIQYLGEVTDEARNELMKNASAFIFAAEDEDFGIVPVEAMALGTPIIAYKSGGVKETVVDGKTGIFFNALTVESLVNAIKKFEKTTFVKATVVKQAEKFSKDKFVEKMKKIVNDSLQAQE